MIRLAACFVLLSSLATAQEANWPHWRGPGQDGISTASDLPTRWSEDENVAWKVPLPGPAGATPVVWGERILLTTADDDSLAVMCISTSGEVLWQQTVSSGGEVNVRGPEGNLASPSPTVDADRVVVLMGNGQLAAFDHAGDELWKLDLNERYGELDIQFSLTSTPILHEGRVYLQYLHGDGDPTTHEARVICLDAATGDEVWAQERVTGARDECEHSYASPVLYTFGETPLLITHGGDMTIAHDLSDGHEVWRLAGMNNSANYHPTLRFVASPGIAEGLVVIPTAKNGPVFALDPKGIGDLTGSKHVLWQLERNTPDVPSPVIHDGLVYLVRETGQVQCFDSVTGEEFYNERTTGGQHRASPLVADGHLYVTARGGEVKVVQLGREFELVATNSLGADQTASPIAIGDTLYLRTFDALWAIRASE